MTLTLSYRIRSDRTDGMNKIIITVKINKQRLAAKMRPPDAHHLLARLNLGSCSLTQNKCTLFKCRLNVCNVFSPDTEVLNDRLKVRWVISH